MTIFCSSTRNARTTRVRTQPAHSTPPYARCTVFLCFARRLYAVGLNRGIWYQHPSAQPIRQPPRVATDPCAVNGRGRVACGSRRVGYVRRAGARRTRSHPRTTWGPPRAWRCSARCSCHRASSPRAPCWTWWHTSACAHWCVRPRPSVERFNHLAPPPTRPAPPPAWWNSSRAPARKPQGHGRPAVRHPIPTAASCAAASHAHPRRGRSGSYPKEAPRSNPTAAHTVGWADARGPASPHPAASRRQRSGTACNASACDRPPPTPFGVRREPGTAPHNRQRVCLHRPASADLHATAV